MYFQFLHVKLTHYLREKIRGGELTERSLARISGVSQPHVHNVLKGARAFSPEAADMILRALRLTIVDICPIEELGGRMAATTSCRMEAVPVLQARAGPGHHMPKTDQVEGFYPFARPLVAPLVSPAAVILARDGDMEPFFQDRDMVLLDRSELVRTRPDASAAYVVSTPEGALVRYLRLGGNKLYLLSYGDMNEPRAWNYLSLAGRNILEIVRGRIVWIGRKVEVFPSQPLRKAG